VARNIVIRVNIGKRTYITEPVAFYTHEYVANRTRHTAKAAYDGGYKIYNNPVGYLSFRTMKNIPIEELNDLDEMRANLVYSTRNIKHPDDRDGLFEFKLPSVREATEYYR